MAYLRELLKGNTEVLLLFLLREEPKYGYLMAKEVKARSQGFFKLSEGTLYPALHRLEQAGLVVGKWRPSPSGQMRRYYHITPKGVETLERRASQWRGFAIAMNMVLSPEGIS